MKKIFLFLLIIISFKGLAQYPVNTAAGNASTLQYQIGSYGGNIGYVFRASYADTATANLSFIKNVPGQVIRVGDTLWMRSHAVDRWIKLTSAGGTESDPLALKIANNLSDLTNAATARTNLGGTTVGSNLFTATNPSAVRWIRVNADNTITFRSAAETASDLGAITSIPTLQQVTNEGNTTTAGVYTDNNVGFEVLESLPGGSVKAAIGKFSDVGFLTLSNAATYSVTVRPQAALGGFRNIYLPNTGNSTDTLATLSDVRAGGSSSTNIANTSLTADGNYTQDWNDKQLKFHSVSEFEMNTNMASSALHFRLSDDKFGGFSIKGNYNATNNAQIGVTAANGNSSSWLQATSGSKFSSITATPDSIEIAPDVAGKVVIRNIPTKSLVSTDSVLIIDANDKVYNVEAGALGSPSVTTSTSTSLTLTTTGGRQKYYIYTGSADATWTLPAIGTTGQIIKIKNKSAFDLTIQRAGSDEIFSDILITSITLTTGDAYEFQDDGTNWNIN